MITGNVGLSCLVLFNGMMSFSSSSKGSSSGESSHQTEPLPSIIPLPRIVIPLSFVNSIHHSRPDPQALAFVGAMIVPSSCTEGSIHQCASDNVNGDWKRANLVLTFLPGRQCWPHNRGQRMKLAPQGIRMEMEPRSLMPLLYKRRSMRLRRPTSHQSDCFE